MKHQKIENADAARMTLERFGAIRAWVANDSIDRDVGCLMAYSEMFAELEATLGEMRIMREALERLRHYRGPWTERYDIASRALAKQHGLL